MTLKEFLEKNPEAIKEASKCKDVAEFKELTDKVGITFDSEEKLNKAFELVKSQSATELSDEALDAVSGGAVHEVELKNLYWNNEGRTILTKTGKKVK